MLRSPLQPLGLLQRLILPPLPIRLTQRFYAAPAKGKGKQEDTPKAGGNKVSVRDAPIGLSNVGRKWFDKDWKKKQRLTQIELKKKVLAKKAKRQAERAKKNPNLVPIPKPKKMQRGTTQGLDRESQRKNRKENVDTEEGDIRDGDFLFQYAKFNLGEQALNKVVSVHIREAMWQLYDADSVCIICIIIPHSHRSHHIFATPHGIYYYIIDNILKNYTSNFFVTNKHFIYS